MFLEWKRLHNPLSLIFVPQAIFRTFSHLLDDERIWELFSLSKCFDLFRSSHKFGNPWLQQSKKEITIHVSYGG